MGIETANLNHNALLKAGYRMYPPPLSQRCDRCYQLRVRDENGTRFFVNVRFWQHSRYGESVSDSYDSFAQFTGRDSVVFDIARLYHVGDTPEIIAAWFQDVWERMGCNYYERTK